MLQIIISFLTSIVQNIFAHADLVSAFAGLVAALSAIFTFKQSYFLRENLPSEKKNVLRVTVNEKDDKLVIEGLDQKGIEDVLRLLEDKKAIANAGNEITTQVPTGEAEK